MNIPPPPPPMVSAPSLEKISERLKVVQANIKAAKAIQTKFEDEQELLLLTARMLIPSDTKITRYPSGSFQRSVKEYYGCKDWGKYFTHLGDKIKNGESPITVLSVLGKKLLNEPFNKLNDSELPDGVYRATINTVTFKGSK